MADSTTTVCENCGEVHGAIGACMLGVVAGVVRDRGEYTEEQLLELLPQIDVSWFWDRWGGPAADWLEEQLGELVGDR